MILHDWKDRDLAEYELNELNKEVKTLQEVIYPKWERISELEQAIQDHDDVQHALDQ